MSIMLHLLPLFRSVMWCKCIKSVPLFRTRLALSFQEEVERLRRELEGLGGGGTPGGAGAPEEDDEDDDGYPEAEEAQRDPTDEELHSIRAQVRNAPRTRMAFPLNFFRASPFRIVPVRCPLLLLCCIAPLLLTPLLQPHAVITASAAAASARPCRNSVLAETLFLEQVAAEMAQRMTGDLSGVLGESIRQEAEQQLQREEEQRLRVETELQASASRPGLGARRPRAVQAVAPVSAPRAARPRRARPSCLAHSG